MGDIPQASFSLSAANQESLAELVWSIEAFKGEFRLILARCNHVNLRSQIVEQLQAEGVQILPLNNHETRLYSRVQAFGAAHHPEALMILGLESLEQFDELITVANKVREDFQKDCPFPVIFWINARLFARMLRLAPDLESWATSITFEAIAPLEIAQFVTDTADQWFAGTLGFNRDQYLELARELETAQLELRRSPDLLTAALRADLQSLMGYTHKLQNQMTEALNCFRQALALWQDSANLERQLKIVDEIVVCLYLPTSFSKEITTITALESIKELSSFISLYLKLIEQINKPELLPQSSLWIDGILEFLDEKQRFETLVQQGLKRHRSSNQWLNLARDYGFLAQIQLDRQNWQEANRLAQDALKVLEENFFKVKGTAATQEQFSQRELQNDQNLYHFLVAQAQHGLGNLAAEIEYLEKAKGLDIPDRQTRLYLKVLSALQVAYRQDQQYLEAFKAKHKLQSLEQQYGLRAFVGAGRVQPQKKAEALQGLTEGVAEEHVAQEIAVSGRQLDVDRLLQRIGRSDYRLIVIHGFSGVGKSSLVEGGLVPALKRSSLAVEGCLPVTLRVYTNWLDELRQQLRDALKERGVTLPDLDPPQPPLERGEQERNGEEPAALVRGEKEKIEQILGELRQWAENLQIVLVFDQFEEFFFLCTDPLQRRAFFEFLGQCLNILNVNVLLSLREDYLHYLLECNRLDSMKIIGNDILSKNVLYPLGNFSPEDAKTIIEQLTQQSSFRLEPSLIAQLVADLAGQLQEVRPIELQIVGAQLEAEKITTLEQYEASGKKQELVKRYLAGTVADCGDEHQQIAELVLYLLTDEQGTRPLKTRDEIVEELTVQWERQDKEKEIAALMQQLDLVFKIFVDSGLVLLVKESPRERYQLVHDYLAGVIRQNQEPQWKKWVEDLKARNEALTAANKRAKRWIQLGSVALFATAAAAVGAGFWAENRRQVAVSAEKQAEIAEEKANTAVDEADRKVKDADRRVDEADQRVQLANGKVTEAQKKLADLGAATEKEKREAQAQVASAKTQADEARQEKIQAEQAKVEAIRQSQDAEARRLIAEKGKQEADTLKRQAEGFAAAAKRDVAAAQVELTKANIESLVVESSNLFQSGQQFQALLKAMKAAQELKKANLETDPSALPMKTITTLREAVYGVHEFQSLTLSDSVNSASFSPDGKTVAVAGNKTLKLWDLSGQEIETLSYGNFFFRHVSFSDDGKTLVSADQDGIVKLWNLEKKENPKTLTRGGVISSISLSGDGNTLAIASYYDTMITVWDLEGQGKPKTFFHVGSPDAHEVGVSQVRLNRDGKILASVSDDRTINLRNLATGEELKPMAHGDGDYVTYVSFSDDGKTLVSADWDGTIKLWDSSTGKEIQTLTHSSPITSISSSHDDQTFASAGYDGTIKLWDLTTGKEIQTFTHGSPIISISFSSDGKTLASASENGIIKWWDLDGQKLETLSLDEHTNINDITFSSDGKTLASIIASNSYAGDVVKLWNLATGQELKTLPHGGRGISVRFSPDGKILASSGSGYLSDDGTVKLWDLTTGQEIKTLPYGSRVVNVSFSHDGKTFGSISYDGTVKLWNLDGYDGTPKWWDLADQTSRSLYIGYISNASFSNDGKTLASADSNGVIKLWNLTTGQEFETLDLLSGMSFSSVGFSPDSKTLAFIDRFDRKIKLWNLTTGQELQTFKFTNEGHPIIRFSPDGRTFAFTENNGIQLWDMAGQKLTMLNSQPTTSISFSPDGKTLASASYDNNVIELWNLDLDNLLSLGCTWMQSYLVTHPRDLENLTVCQTPDLRIQAAPYLLLEGDGMAIKGQIDDAIKVYQQALQWNPNLGIVPEKRAKQQARQAKAKALVQVGNEFASLGNIAEAVSKFQEALAVDPDVDLDPNTKEGDQDPQTVVAAPLKVNEGEQLAREGKIDEAVLKFQEALELDPNIDLTPKADGIEQNPQAVANRLAAPLKVYEGLQLAQEGKIDEAILAYEQAQELYPEVEIGNFFWGKLCWYGSLYGHAEKVLFAGEKAVELSQDSWYINTRGLARALTGDFTGAIADFQTFVDDPNYSKESRAQREEWIKTLKQGKNPFTPEVLDKLIEQSQGQG